MEEGGAHHAVYDFAWLFRRDGRREHFRPHAAPVWKRGGANLRIKKKTHRRNAKTQGNKAKDKDSMSARVVRPLLRALLHVYGACGVRRTLHGGVAACDGGRARGSGSGRHILVDRIAVRVVEETVGRVLGDKDISACRTTTCSIQCAACNMQSRRYTGTAASIRRSPCGCDC